MEGSATTTVHLPPPVRRPPAQAAIDVEALERELRAHVDGEVRFDAGSRAAYSTDASNYRQIPIGLVVPRTVDAAVEAIAVCRRFGAPVLSRGGGTSLGGQCTNVAVVLDWSKYCNRLVSVAPERRTCVVEPGIVLDHLNDLVAGHGLEFGPRPATHSHCTIGGMIGNNSCGATAQRTGKVADNISRLEVLLYDGTRCWVGPTDDEAYARAAAEGGRFAEVLRALRALRDRYGDDVRAGFPDIPRRVSGYNLDALLPEHGFDVARALVGSEGTLVTVLHAELKLVERVKAKALVVLGYPDLARAADDVPRIVPFAPIALEAFDDKVVSLQHAKDLHPEALELLPEGRSWLLVETGGETEADADATAARVLGAVGRDRDDATVTVYDDERHRQQLWEVREAALGATARAPNRRDAWPGFEDSAVHPDRLGAYLRDLEGLFEEFGYTEASLYGHFGQGCVHVRIPFDLVTVEGLRRFRAFMERAADLVTSYGGSLSGEHGDGQARGELLVRMFGPTLVQAMGEMKAIFDPDDRMNPGKVVAPRPLDDDLRLGARFAHDAGSTYFRFPDDDGSFSRGVMRCVGVGKCRREGGGVMCPSYMVTREEEHSTRGRSRLLFEMLDGTARGGTIGDGWRSQAVLDALDLCLACKGCKSDCPVNVDMATYKAEFLAHHYKGRLRPASHYSMGWLPLWAALAAPAAPVVNWAARTPVLARTGKRLAGVSQQRRAPELARTTFQRWFRRRPDGPDGPDRTAHRGDVVLWPDTFTNHFEPNIARDATTVLEDAGWRVVVPERHVCCGLTWISTGQLATASRILRRAVRTLRPHLRAGTPVVVLEPSCAAVFRSDAKDLFPHDQDVERLRVQTFTLAELLHDRSPGWQPPPIHRDAVAQVHCHQHAVMGYESDQALLGDAGVELEVLDSGCCGLAGNFGFEAGHYDVSMACAERVLLPAVRAAPRTTLVLADGFSCRTQIRQGRSQGREPVHLAEVLAEALTANGHRG